MDSGKLQIKMKNVRESTMPFFDDFFPDSQLKHCEFCIIMLQSHFCHFMSSLLFPPPESLHFLDENPPARYDGKQDRPDPAMNLFLYIAGAQKLTNSTKFSSEPKTII